MKISFTAPDSFLKQGDISANGTKMLTNFRAPITATAIKELETAGATLASHTSIIPTTTRSTSITSATLTNHTSTIPPDKAQISLDLDTGGNLLNLAATHHNIGFKPTYGTVSRYGIIAVASSIDTVGVLALSIANIEFTMKTIAGQDPNDATSLPDFWDKAPTTKPLRIGFISDFKDLTLENQLQTSGHKTDNITININKYAQAICTIIKTAEFASNMMRFDGVRFGHRATDVKNIDELYTKSRIEGLTSENIHDILLGNYFTSSENFDAYFSKAMKARTLLVQAYEKAFQDFDILIAESIPENTIPPSLVGLPAISLPFAKNQLLLISNRQADRTLLRFATELEKTN